jgi:hypothetical protein
MLNLINEFESIVKEIHGIYLDTEMGFTLILRGVEEMQKKMSLEIGKSIEDLDKLPFRHSSPEMGEIHTETQGEFKIRMSTGGRNHTFAANMCIISIYQYWEDHYRSAIAEALGKNKNDLKAPIMGDIRLLRNSIIHHKAIALKELEKAEIVNWFKENDQIKFDRNQIVLIIRLVYQYIEELKYL